ncbi:hypothetical protein IFM89_015400 [Coptis chinensis]|uniref:non-specific serine/threonine protein kinase n=1 Tax=Coptis chinensis TaxID=261450 RepID=A0A835IWK3_9MAGN|nr:hypothetical protein IFM89_015400 [Coptis chinensis]
MEERYELLKELGSGKFAVARLVRDKKTQELFAVKYLERGEKIDEKVRREIFNHRSLKHPNIVRFKEIILTPIHLAIVMEYAAGGELFNRICTDGRFSEDEEICHRDLKLENTLLDVNTSPRLKICDFGHSKSGILHSKPHSTVGTPGYIAPEVLSTKEYDGKVLEGEIVVEGEGTDSMGNWSEVLLEGGVISVSMWPAVLVKEDEIADVWSCGVTLYVMLIGVYPFEDTSDPINLRKTIGRIIGAQYSIPDYIHLSSDCRLLLSQIFVSKPLENLPEEFIGVEKSKYQNLNSYEPTQSIEEIARIIEEARIPADHSKSGRQCMEDTLDHNNREAEV